MKINEFKAILKKAKRGTFESGMLPLKVFKRENNGFRIESTKILHKTYDGAPREIFVYFHQPHSLTIFESGMLFYLFAYNKILIDYGAFHSCIAGKEFIENLREVKR